MSRGSRLHTATSSVTKKLIILPRHMLIILVLYCLICSLDENNNLQFSIRKNGDKHVCLWHVQNSKSAILSHFYNYCTQKAMLSKLSREKNYISITSFSETEFCERFNNVDNLIWFIDFFFIYISYVLFEKESTKCTSL